MQTTTRHQTILFVSAAVFALVLGAQQRGRRRQTPKPAAVYRSDKSHLDGRAGLLGVSVGWFVEHEGFGEIGGVLTSAFPKTLVRRTTPRGI